MSIVLDGTNGITTPDVDSGPVSGTNFSYTGTLTGGTGVVNLGSGQVYKDASGNVGIGTSSPGCSLQVTGGIRARGGAPGAGGVNNNGYAFSGNGGDVDSGMFSSADGQLEFYTNAFQAAVMDSSGFNAVELFRQGAIATSIGVNQTWQNVTASRAVGSTYTNTTGRPIYVTAYFTSCDANREAVLSTDGLEISATQAAVGADRITVTGIIRAGAQYSITVRFGSTSTLTYWAELR